MKVDESSGTGFVTPEEPELNWAELCSVLASDAPKTELELAVL